LGFLTLLRLADRRDRSPAAALGLFFATSLETIGGTVLGLVVASRASDAKQPGKGLLLGAAAAVLGVIATIQNFNWMRTRRRL
jgi:zinc transporter ZupT